MEADADARTAPTVGAVLFVTAFSAHAEVTAATFKVPAVVTLLT
jgi:hypothetical protein